MEGAGHAGGLRRAARAVLGQVVRTDVARRALASLVASLDDDARVGVLFEALWALGAEQRLDLARRLCASVEAWPDQDEARGQLVVDAAHLLRHTGGACAARAGEVVQACLDGAQADGVEAAFRALAEQGRRDPRTLEYALSIASGWLAALRRFGAGLEGARILELGPGYTLVGGIALHCHGAASYVGVDLFPLLSRGTATYRELRARLAERPLVPDPALAARALERFDRAVDLAGPEARFPTGAIVHRHPVDAADLPFPDGAFDVVLSNACFEHVRDAARAARECARVTAPGGLGLHQIDLRDHRDFSRPLEFLTERADAWEASFEAGAFVYTNRLRRAELAALFEAAGQRVLAVEVNGRHAVTAELRARLQPQYRDLPEDELSAVSCLFAVRRP